MTTSSSTLRSEGAGALVPVDEPDLRVRHRDLPVMLGGELDRLVGFVQIVRLLGGMLGVLGTLAAVAGVALGLPMLTVVAVLLSTLILYALWEDTRLASALELLRRRRMEAAEEALATIAGSPRRSAWQRQRARTYLASLAWRRGDVEQALSWIQARLAAPRRSREEPTERWLALATEAQLLAQAGHAAEAREALDRLPPPPPDEQAELVEAQTALLVAFVADEPDRVRGRVDEWTPMIDERDGVGLGVALLAWANAGRGERDRAIALTREVRSRDRDGHLARFYPRLWQWIERYDERYHPGRR
ncbi:MAG: hypothetical protein H6712_08750 [Myxococcales bacterium]|nr:hypothetical protein [Myxococcales bacterium]MCB9713928.1 hypothetical protein [Myxococcales bacterium]